MTVFYSTLTQDAVLRVSELSETFLLTQRYLHTSTTLVWSYKQSDFQRRKLFIQTSITGVNFTSSVQELLPPAFILTSSSQVEVSCPPRLISFTVCSSALREFNNQISIIKWIGGLSTYREWMQHVHRYCLKRRVDRRPLAQLVERTKAPKTNSCESSVTSDTRSILKFKGVFVWNFLLSETIYGDLFPQTTWQGHRILDFRYLSLMYLRSRQAVVESKLGNFCSCWWRPGGLNPLPFHWNKRREQNG